MNSKERINAVVALETPDRAPVGPLLDHYAATYTGITNQELIEDGKKRIEAVIKTAVELGPWDITFMGEMANLTLLMGGPARLYLPGKELGKNEIHQYEEFELLTPDDYDLFEKLGLFRFLREVGLRLYPHLKGWKGISMMLSFAWEIRKHAKKVRANGIEPACGFILPGPLFEYFSIGRSMQKMCADLFDCPQKIKSAGKLWAEAMSSLAVKFSKFVGVHRVFIGLSRTSPAMISPRHFEEFILPELSYMINTIVDAGMTPLLHCDTNWTKNFNFFRSFPAKKCILELDGSSDIFKAKEMLGDRMCIMGDVPAYLLAFSQKDEVLNYCKRLIETVGKGGGFILSSGCSVPANAKEENVRAIYEAAEEWGYY